MGRLLAALLRAILYPLLLIAVLLAIAPAFVEQGPDSPAMKSIIAMARNGVPVAIAIGVIDGAIDP